MNKTKSFVLIAILLLVGCSFQLVKNASISYKTHKDNVSLQMIYKHLTKGMKRTDVESLLGEPDYCPIQGQYYYSSDRTEYPAGDRANQAEVPVGVVLDYRNEEGVLTDELQTFWLGPIGE